MGTLKNLLLQISNQSLSEPGYPTFVAALVAGLFFVLMLNIHAAIQAMPDAPSGVVYPINSGP